MNNQVNLTDDELSAIMTALQVVLMGIKKYESQGKAVDIQTKQANEEIKALYERLGKEYF